LFFIYSGFYYFKYANNKFNIHSLFKYISIDSSKEIFKVNINNNISNVFFYFKLKYTDKYDLY